VPVDGASVGSLNLNFYPLWKSNKKVLQCQRIFPAVHLHRTEKLPADPHFSS
jgi:hypothetical protein